VTGKTDWWYTMREASDLCGVSVDTIKRRLRAGSFPQARPPADGAGAWHVSLGDLVQAGFKPLPERTHTVNGSSAGNPIGVTGPDVPESPMRVRVALAEERSRASAALADERARHAAVLAALLRPALDAARSQPPIPRGPVRHSPTCPLRRVGVRPDTAPNAPE